MRSRQGRFLSVAFTVVLVAGLAGAPGRAGAVATVGDRPGGFWYGTDSLPVSFEKSMPRTEPVIGGAYGGYMGMIGDWAKWQHCGDYPLAWSPADSAVANANLAKSDRGVGTGAYWFMGGPGVDPHYQGSTAEAYRWGELQAARALSDIRVAPVRYPVVFMDVEFPGSTRFGPATDNGWSEVYSSACGGRVTGRSFPVAVARADINGFAAFIRRHSTYKVGVYSSPATWVDIFGTGRAATLTDTYEWTFSADTSSLSRPPSGWCLAGTSTCAEFFGGVGRSSRYALMWQWSGGGGTSNGVGDFDQINATTVRSPH